MHTTKQITCTQRTAIDSLIAGIHFLYFTSLVLFWVFSYITTSYSASSFNSYALLEWREIWSFGGLELLTSYALLEWREIWSFGGLELLTSYALLEWREIWSFEGGLELLTSYALLEHRGIVPFVWASWSENNGFAACIFPSSVVGVSPPSAVGVSL